MDFPTIDDVDLNYTAESTMGDNQLDVPPSPSSDPKLFSSERFRCLLKALANKAESDQMDLKHYTDLYFESLKLFKFFGSAVALGFKDIQDKAHGIIANQKQIKEAGSFSDESPEIRFIEQLMNYEISHKLAPMNQGNNKKILNKDFNKDEVKNWMYSYQSTCWIVLRGAWFFDFMAEIIHLLVTDRQMDLQKAASIAYDTKLGPHHPWILRKLIKVALNAVTSRESFIKAYATEKELALNENCDVSEEAIYNDLTEFYQL